MSLAKYIYHQGEFVEWEKATVHVFSPAVKYGAGVFEGIRAYWNEAQEQLYVFRLQEHNERLVFSQRAMRFDKIYPAAEVSDLTLELLRRNETREGVHIRPTVYVDGYGEPGSLGPAELSISSVARPAPAYRDAGCRVQVSAWQRIADRAMPARIKANANYNNSRFATIQARVDGYDTAVMMNDRGLLAEGPGMCIFLIRNGVAITPTITNDILESITRDAIITILREDLGVEVVERDVNRSELYACDEAFFCGTAWEVTPIVNVDGFDLGDGTVGPIGGRLKDRFLGIADGSIEDTRGWLTPVY